MKTTDRIIKEALDGAATYDMNLQNIVAMCKRIIYRSKIMRDDLIGNDQFDDGDLAVIERKLREVNVLLGD